ncbi:MAG: hypothetical protein RIK87_18540 [Fuerstiella sp.]
MNLLVPNLDFEDELAGRQVSRSAGTVQVLTDLAPLMGLLAGPGDMLLTDAAVDGPGRPDWLRYAEIPSVDLLTDAETQIVPWGWSDTVRQLAARVGMPPERIPPAHPVRQVNGRNFSSRFDYVKAEDRSCRMPFGRQSFGTLCCDMGQWQSAVQRLAAAGYHRWIAKPEHSHAGRNRLLATGTSLNQQQQAWLDRHLNSETGVYVEPWVERTEEAGLQFDIACPESGASADDAEAGIRFLGATQLLNDRMGRFFGSVTAADPYFENRWEGAIQHGLSVCRAARALGYFGPLGIDCFGFRTPGGREMTRFCNDINARFTMGRLALQLRSQLKTGELGAWCQFATRRFSTFLESMRKTLGQAEFCDVRAVVTSPLSVGGRPVCFGTVLLVAEALDRLSQAAETLKAVAAE